MKLYIDTADRNKVILGIDDKRFERESKEGSSQMLLPFIDEILISEGRNLKDIKEIEVNTGPGSFTGLRVGVAIANTLGFVLKVPVDGKISECDIIY
jgi:tRNA threonylcarbamoyladenosine biosynthesis protein TsaB